MRSGALRTGERLPSSRALAALLGVSRTVVTDAFQQLYAEGWLDGRHGSGTYVTASGDGVSAGRDATGRRWARRRTEDDPVVRGPVPDRDQTGIVDLRPGRP